MASAVLSAHDSSFAQIPLQWKLRCVAYSSPGICLFLRTAKVLFLLSAWVCYGEPLLLLSVQSKG